MNHLSTTLPYGFLIYVVVLLVTVTCDSAKSTCDFHDVCSCKKDGKMVTLRPFDLSNAVAFTLQQKGKNFKIKYNPCTPFTDDKDQKCNQVLACQENTGFQYPLADPKTASFSVNNEGNVVFAYSAASQTDKTTRKLEVTLKCDKNAEKPSTTEVTENDSNIKFPVYSFQLTTKCACPGLCSSEVSPKDKGLSFGSILVIIFFVFLAVYFIGGFLFLRFYMKKEGSEAVPNHEFWSDFPKKVKDGCEFTWNMIRKKDSEYQQI